MCNFVDQFGEIHHHVLKHGVDVSRVDAEVAFPRRCRPHDRISLLHTAPPAPGKAPTLVLEDGNWGLHLPGFRGLTTNARDDRLATSPLWQTMWGQAGHHVVIPISHGYEFTKRTGERVWSCIQRRDGDPWLVAGLGREQDGRHRREWHVSMVTTDAGSVFEPIHDTPREVVCLRDWDEALTWLDADRGECQKLIRAATPDVLATHRVSDDVLREGFPPGAWPNRYQPSSGPQQGLDAFG